MSPTVDYRAQDGARDASGALGDATNGKPAQPPTNGEETKICLSEGVAKTEPKNDEPSKEPRKLQTMNERFQFDPEKPKQKNKKKKGGFMKRGPTALVKNRGTGFEDYYCDPPMTPAEVEEEKNDIYPPDRPFVDRIEECIQRYRARRRMDNARANLFDKYLALGGVDTSPRMFQGVKSLDMDGATNNDIRGMTAGDVVHRGSSNNRYYNTAQAEHWDVDFSGVVAGYFSERIFKLAGTDLGVIKLAADVVENFLNYVLHHDVCPEYADDVKKAKAICRESLDQISRCFQVTWEGPGDFNIACSALLDHGKRRVFDPDSTSDEYSMPVEHAQRVFYASVAVHSFLFQRMGGKPLKNLEAVDEVKQAFEVVDIREPDEQQAQTYLGVRDIKGETGKVKPCGKLTLRAIDLDDGWDKGSFSGPAPGIGDQEEFVLDCAVLQHMTVGMKLKLAVCIVDTGFKFIKAFTDVRPRYYTFLPQELMMNYKEPVPNEREAPSVANPDVGVEDAADAKVDD